MKSRKTEDLNSIVKIKKNRGFKQYSQNQEKQRV